MKQILLVLALTALAAVGFVVARKLGEPAVSQTASSQAPVGPRTPAATPPTVQRAQTPQPATPPQVSMDWREFSSRSWSIDPADGWAPDLSAVDFDAEVLCMVGDLEIRRDDFRKYLSLTAARPLVDAWLSWHLAAHAAAQRGIDDIRLGEDVHALVIRRWAEERQLEPEVAPLVLAHFVRMPVLAALKLRELALEGTLASFRGITALEQIPEADRQVLVPEPHQREQMPNLLRGIEDGMALYREEGDPEGLFLALRAVETLTLFQDPLRVQQAERRSFTFLDGTTRPGVVAAVALGPVPPGELLPPWLLPGELGEVHLDDIWELIGENLERMALERYLREWIYFAALLDEQERQGIAIEPETAWRTYYQEYLASQGVVFDVRQLQLMFHRFPSMAHYRALERLRQGYEGSLPEDWDSEERQRSFFADNRFLVEGWEPDIEVVVFPAEMPVDGQPVVDWAGARSAAEALVERAAAGEDFSQLRLEHHAALVDRMRRELGESAALEFANKFPVGARRMALNQLRLVLGDTRFDEMVRCYSPLLSATKVLEPGEISPPWLTSFGWILVRVHGARLSQLEREYDDLVDQTLFYLRDLQYQRWANEVLSSREFQVPTAG